jgi:hypothetical protein
MRIFLLTALAVVFVLPGCASRAPATVKKSSPPPPPAAVGKSKSNRFEMTQNGRRMSADDFDRWMKARGIRVAKGKPKAKQAASKQTTTKAKAQPKP